MDELFNFEPLPVTVCAGSLEKGDFFLFDNKVYLMTKNQDKTESAKVYYVSVQISGESRGMYALFSEEFRVTPVKATGNITFSPMTTGGED